jgi:hypothetical protein
MEWGHGSPCSDDYEEKSLSCKRGRMCRDSSPWRQETVVKRSYRGPASQVQRDQRQQRHPGPKTIGSSALGQVGSWSKGCRPSSSLPSKLLSKYPHGEPHPMTTSTEASVPNHLPWCAPHITGCLNSLPYSQGLGQGKEQRRCKGHRCSVGQQ